MRTINLRKFEMFKRVRVYGENHSEQFPAGSAGRAAFDDLGAAVDQLREHAVAKMTSEGAGRTRRVSARQALETRLEHLSRSARAIAHDHPGFADGFRLPRPRSDEKLVMAGHAFIQGAEAGKDRFATYGMSGDFVESLKTLVADFERAVREWQDGRDGHTAAVASIESGMAAAHAALRKLDIVVPNRLENDPVALAVWEQDRKVTIGRRRKSAAADVATTEAAPPVVTPEPPATTDKSTQAA